MEQQSAQEDDDQGSERAEECGELRYHPCGAWDFPLSRSEKVRRLLTIFDGEVSSGEREVEELRRENEALRRQAAAAEDRAAEFLRQLEAFHEAAAAVPSSERSQSEIEEQDSQFFQFQREMEAKAMVAEAAAASLLHEVEEQSLDFDYESVAESSDRMEMEPVEPHSVVVCTPPPNTPLRRSLAEPTCPKSAQGGEGCTGGSPTLDAPPPSPAQKQGFAPRRLSPRRTTPRGCAATGRWSGLLLPGIKERDVSQERLQLTPVLHSARSQRPATGPRGMRALRASPRLHAHR